MQSRHLAAALLAATLAAPDARAQLLLDRGAGVEAALPPRTSDWTLTLGALGAVAPAYEGSDAYLFRALPVIDLRFRDLAFASVRDGIGVNVVRNEWLTLAPVVRYRFGRDQDDNRALFGLGDVDGTVEVGALANLTYMGFNLRLDAVQGVNGGGHEGFFARADLTYAVRPTPRLLLAAGPSATFTDSSFNQSYFGVTPEQARRSGYRVYSPAGGIKDVGVGANATYALGGGFALSAVAEVKQLLGDVADSQIVKDETQGFIGIGISWRGGL
jgi:outer membrane scaffolding protein for murein synthesis (MipA/OmpV family)